MKTATISEAKSRLSALIDRVRSGESVLILDRGTPVARLEPVGGGPDPSGRLARLERAGVLRSGRAAPPVDLVRTAGPRVPTGSSVLATLLDERHSGR
jgi:prevent-host-death family protein